MTVVETTQFVPNAAIGDAAEDSAAPANTDFNFGAEARRVWTAEEVREKLASSNAWLERGIFRLYLRQTEDEKHSGETSHRNGRGFNGTDAAFGTSLAQRIERLEVLGIPAGRRLSPNQVAAARKMMVKYARQLAMVANEQPGPQVVVAEVGQTDVQQG